MIEINNRLICQNGSVLSVNWEDLKIDVPLNLNNMSEVVLYRLVRNMQKEINILKEAQMDYIRYKFKNVSNDVAKEMVFRYLLVKKVSVDQISLFQISQELELPANQVEDILEGFESEDQIKWVGA